MSYRVFGSSSDTGLDNYYGPLLNSYSACPLCKSRAPMPIDCKYRQSLLDCKFYFGEIESNFKRSGIECYTDVTQLLDDFSGKVRMSKWKDLIRDYFLFFNWMAMNGVLNNDRSKMYEQLSENDYGKTVRQIIRSLFMLKKWSIIDTMKREGFEFSYQSLVGAVSHALDDLLDDKECLMVLNKVFSYYNYILNIHQVKVILNYRMSLLTFILPHFPKISNYAKITDILTSTCKTINQYSDMFLGSEISKVITCSDRIYTATLIRHVSTKFLVRYRFNWDSYLIEDFVSNVNIVSRAVFTIEQLSYGNNIGLVMKKQLMRLVLDIGIQAYRNNPENSDTLINSVRTFVSLYRSAYATIYPPKTKDKIISEFIALIDTEVVLIR